MDSKAFNTGQRPRVKWQNGDDPGDQYRVPYRFFNVCNSRNYRPPSEKEKKGFHSWVINAVTKPGQTRAMINAPMPSYLSYKEGQPLRSIFKCNPPSFNEGDIVVMTFRFGVFIGRKNWKPDIMPEEFIRVAKAEELQDGLSSSSFRWQVDDRNFDRLEANAIVAPIVTQGMSIHISSRYMAYIGYNQIIWKWDRTRLKSQILTQTIRSRSSLQLQFFEEPRYG